MPWKGRQLCREPEPVPFFRRKTRLGPLAKSRCVIEGSRCPTRRGLAVAAIDRVVRQLALRQNHGSKIFIAVGLLEQVRQQLTPALQCTRRFDPSPQLTQGIGLEAAADQPVAAKDVFGCHVRPNQCSPRVRRVEYFLDRGQIRQRFLGLTSPERRRRVAEPYRFVRFPEEWDRLII